MTAAPTLPHQYEPEVRRAIRVRLTDPRLRRVFDSVDICQSVLANFFVRLSVGEYDLQRPEDLLNLLLTMARNKIFDKARRLQAEKRNRGRVDHKAAERLDLLPAADNDPGEIVAGEELLARVKEQLSDDERSLADMRVQGHQWNDLAQERGVKPDALRKKLSRAVDKALSQLGLEESYNA